MRGSRSRLVRHSLPNLIGEMQSIGTVEAAVTDLDDFVGAIAGGEANKRIKAPDSLQHRYYREDFGHGLLPFIELAGIAGVATPVADALFALAQALVERTTATVAEPQRRWASPECPRANFSTLSDPNDLESTRRRHRRG